MEKGGLGEALVGAGVKAETVLGFADEMRVGLRGMVRRVWGRRGVKVRHRVQTVYEWRCLFCVVDGRRGKLLWSWIDSMTSRRIAEAVNGLKQGTDMEALVWDDAGGHRSRLVEAVNAYLRELESDPGRVSSLARWDWIEEAVRSLPSHYAASSR